VITSSGLEAFRFVDAGALADFPEDPESRIDARADYWLKRAAYLRAVGAADRIQ